MVLLDDLGDVCMHEQLLSLRFAFCIGTIYVEKEIFDNSGQICETVLQRNSTTIDGVVWNLTCGMYRVFGLTDAQLSTSMVLVTPRNSTSTLQVPTQPTVKIEPSDVNVHVISDSDDDAILDGPIGDTSAIPIRRHGSIGSTLSLPTPDLRRSPSISSSRPPVYLTFRGFEVLLKPSSRQHLGRALDLNLRPLTLEACRSSRSIIFLLSLMATRFLSYRLFLKDVPRSIEEIWMEWASSTMATPGARL